MYEKKKKQWFFDGFIFIIAPFSFGHNLIHRAGIPMRFSFFFSKTHTVTNPFHVHLNENKTFPFVVFGYILKSLDDFSLLEGIC